MRKLRIFFIFLLIAASCYSFVLAWNYINLYLNKPFGSGEKIVAADTAVENKSVILSIGTIQNEAVFSANEKITFFIKIENHGHAELNNISAKIAVPADGAFLQDEAEQTLASLAAGEAHVFTWEAMLSSYESSKKEPYKTLTYTAQASYTPADGNDAQTLSAQASLKTASDFGAVNERQISEMPWLYSYCDEGWVHRNMAAEGIYMKFGMQVSYIKGVSAKTNAEFDVYLGGDSYRLRAIIGADIRTAEDGASLQFVVLNDGEEVFRSKDITVGDFDVMDITLKHCRVATFKIEATGNTQAVIGNWANLRASRSSAQELQETTAPVPGVRR